MGCGGGGGGVHSVMPKQYLVTMATLLFQTAFIENS